MFEVTIRRTFDAGHALRNAGHLTEVPHNHCWECEITVGAERLDEMGIAVDFYDIEEALDHALKPLMGKQLHLIELFSNVSPSAENVAYYLYQAVAKHLHAHGARVVRTRVWEDSHHRATYYE